MTAAKAFWPDRDPQLWHFTHDVRMTPEEFAELQERDPHHLGVPYDSYRLRIARDGRNAWHLVCRQYSFGQPRFYAQKIIIQLPNAQAAP